jgi:hypothetical protein
MVNVYRAASRTELKLGLNEDVGPAQVAQQCKSDKQVMTGRPISWRRLVPEDGMIIDSYICTLLIHLLEGCTVHVASVMHPRPHGLCTPDYHAIGCHSFM